MSRPEHVQGGDGNAASNFRRVQERNLLPRAWNRMAKFARLDGNPHYQLTVPAGRQSRFFVNIDEKKVVTFFRHLSWNYAAACGLLNATGFAPKPRDSSMGAGGKALE
jgi:hypothetical protein